MLEFAASDIRVVLSNDVNTVIATAYELIDIGETMSGLIVPLLQEAGVEFLHIGVNPASTATEVPRLFRWRDEKSKSETVVMYNSDCGTPSTVPGSSVSARFRFRVSVYSPGRNS